MAACQNSPSTHSGEETFVRCTRLHSVASWSWWKGLLRWIQNDQNEGGRNEVALHSDQGDGRPDPGLRAAAHSCQRLPRYWAGGLGGPRRGCYRPGDRRQHAALGGRGRTPRARTARQAERTRSSSVRLKGVRGSPWGCRGGGELGSAQRQVGCAHGRGAARCGSRQGAYLLVPEPEAKFRENSFQALR